MGQSKRTAIAILLALTFGGTSAARADGPASAAEQEVADAIAALRASERVAPLVRDADLDEAALIHAEDMAAHDFVGHVSPRSGDPTARVRAVGARVRRVGENVARAHTPEEAVHGFEASASHRAQIVSPDYTHFGVAVVEDEEGFYVVEVFAARPSAVIPPPAVAEVEPEPAQPDVAMVEPSVDENADAPAADAQIAEAPTTEVAPAEVAPSEPSVPNVPNVPNVADATPIAPDPSSMPPADAAPSSIPESPVAPSYPAYPYASNGQTPPPPAASSHPTYPYATNGQVPSAQASAVAPGSVAGAPRVQLQGAPPPNVQGYWVQASGRWWYYPIPPNARPGQVLTPSSTVTGGPNTAAVPGSGSYAAPSPRRGLFRPSPRRF